MDLGVTMIAFRLAAAATMAVTIAFGLLPPSIAPESRYELAVLGSIFGVAYISYEIWDIFRKK
jgi:hypothetical protein